MTSTDDGSYIGKQIGNYIIQGRLGGGGFAHVYLARHIHLINRFVAIKLLDPQYAGSPIERQCFLQEAQILQELKHRHILSILDFGECEGTLYFIAEYVPGGTIRDCIKDENPLATEEAVTILTQVGEAVHTTHQQKIVHCDLKPENILFDKDHDAILTDFGIAIRLGTAPSISGLPRGTYAYMAPEQFKGDFREEGDQYSLGCIAYELFTGKHPFKYVDPFDPHNPALMKNRHQSVFPLPPRALNPTLPVHIEQATLKAMAKEYTERYKSVDKFIQSLQLTTTSPSEPLQPTVNSTQTPQPDTGSSLRQPVTDSPGAVSPVANPPQQLQPAIIPSQIPQKIEKQSMEGDGEQKVQDATQQKSDDVFLICSPEDKDWVEKKIAQRLEDKAGMKIWFPDWRIIPGELWQDAIEKGMKQSKCVVVCLGQQEMDDLSKEQLRVAISIQAEDNSYRVIPVLIPGGKDNLENHPFLKQRSPVDFRTLADERAFSQLVHGVRGTEPGAWPPKQPATIEESSTDKQLRQLKERVDKKLVDPQVALQQQPVILRRDSVWERIRELERREADGTINHEEMLELRKEILKDLL